MAAFTYNNFNDCYYAVICGKYEWYVYNIDEDEYIKPCINYPTFNGIIEQNSPSDVMGWSEAHDENRSFFKFFKDGRFSVYDSVYTPSGDDCIGTMDGCLTAGFIIKNEYYAGYKYGTRFGEQGLGAESSANKSYRLCKDEILSCDKDHNEELVIDLTDVYDEEDWYRIKYLKSENMTISADESRLYYYDDVHNALRVIMRND